MDNQTPDHTNEFEKKINSRPVTPREVSYDNAYDRGRISEARLRQEENLRIRDNENAGRGLLVGILLTSLVGLVAGTTFLFYSNQQTEPTETIAPSPTFSPTPSSDITEPQEPAKQTTIIERTVEKVVPIPQEQPSAPAQSAPTKVEIQVPASPKPQAAKPQPTASQTPQNPAPQTPQNQTQTPPAQTSTQSDIERQLNQSQDLQNQSQPNVPSTNKSTQNSQSPVSNSP